MSSSWEFLCHLKPGNNEPYFCIVDFNEITCQSKKWGENLRLQWQIFAFQEALTYCQLSNIPTYG